MKPQKLIFQKVTFLITTIWILKCHQSVEHLKVILHCEQKEYIHWEY